MSDATQSGVSESNSGPAKDEITEVESPRLAAMAQIAAANELRRQEEQARDDLENGIVRERPQPTEAPKPDGKTGDVDQVNLQLDDDTILTEEQLSKFKVRTKVDGVEQVVPVSTMRADFQKTGAADKRLAEASELLKQARAVAAAPVATPAPPVGADGKPVTGDSSAADGKQPAAVEVKREFLSALFEGDMDKAMAAFDRVMPGASATQSIDQLTAQLTPAVKQQLADESALDKFATDFDYLVADPYLADLADGHLARIQKEKPELSFQDQLDAAGSATRDWMVTKGMKVPEKAAPDATGSPTTDRAKKLAQKAASDQVAGTNVRAVVHQEAPSTPSSVIAEMRKARGMEP